MKLTPVVVTLAGFLLVASPAGAEPWSKQLTPRTPDDNFTVKVERVKGTDVLQVHVTARLKDRKDLPVTKHELRLFDGNEYVALCPVQPTGADGERRFVFRVAAKYAEKSTFSYTLASDFDFNRYWFYLKDYVASE